MERLMSDAPTFMIEDAQIIFRNFAGKEGPFNAEGDRTFNVILDPEMATQMEKDGWNVKYTNPRDDEEEGIPHIQVRVSYKRRPPRVVMLTSTARTNLNEDSIETLDWVDIQSVDLICRGFEWSVNGKTGVKAYLQSLFVKVEEDPLERKYAINDPEG
jgi:hypothetical protein